MLFRNSNRPQVPFGLVVIRIVLCAVTLAVCFRTTQSWADESAKKEPREFGKPVAKLWYPATFIFDYMQFLGGVSKEVNIDTKLIFGSLEEKFADLAKALQGRKSGVLFFMVKKKAANPLEALLPAVNLPEPYTMQFMTAERDEFKSLALKQSNMFGGPSGKIEGDGDLLTFTSNWAQTSFVDKDGNAVHFPNEKKYFRWSNGYMFESSFAELHTMELPNPRDLKRNRQDADWDIFLEADATAIDKKTRGLAWQTVRLATQTALQQLDNEDDTSYFARRSSGEFQLDLLKALMIDTEKFRVGFKYATATEPIKSVFELDARENSDLAKYFGKLSRGDRRLAALRDRPAALTFATSWSIPDAGKKMVDGYFKLGRAKIENVIGTNFEALFAVDDLFKVIAKSLEDGSGDMVLKLARTDREFAVFGGMKLVDAKRMGKSLELLLTTLPGIEGSGVRSSSDEAGRRYLSFLTEDIPFRVVKESIDNVPGRLHFCVSDETLWFCLGGAESLATLKNVVKTASEATRKPNRKSVQFLVELSLDTWLSDDKTADGFSRLPHRALVQVERMIHDWHSGTMERSVYAVSNTQEAGDLNSENPKDGKAKPAKPEPPRFLTPKFSVPKFEVSYLDQLLTKQQSGVRLALDASPKRIRFEANVGLGLAKILIARVLVVQQAWMEEMRKSMPRPPAPSNRDDL